MFRNSLIFSICLVFLMGAKIEKGPARVLRETEPPFKMYRKNIVPLKGKLNSERIKEVFGSVDIEVLEQNIKKGVRLSHLYSTHEKKKITRTFAYVIFPKDNHKKSPFKFAHNKITRGASIGSTLTTAGFDLQKESRFFGEIAVSPKILKMMGDLTDQNCAIYIYDLSVSNAKTPKVHYATIVEIYHPEFLRESELLHLIEEPLKHMEKNEQIERIYKEVWLAMVEGEKNKG